MEGNVQTRAELWNNEHCVCGILTAIAIAIFVTIAVVLPVNLQQTVSAPAMLQSPLATTTSGPAALPQLQHCLVTIAIAVNVAIAITVTVATAVTATVTSSKSADGHIAQHRPQLTDAAKSSAQSPSMAAPAPVMQQW